MSKEIEGMNRVIAEFMGLINLRTERPELKFNHDLWQYGTFQTLLNGRQSPLGPKYYVVDKLLYHESYDWLMPVWFKFRDLENIKPKHVHNSYYSRITLYLANKPISETFELLHEAIEWYNSINQQKK